MYTRGKQGTSWLLSAVLAILGLLSGSGCYRMEFPQFGSIPQGKQTQPRDPDMLSPGLIVVITAAMMDAQLRITYSVTLKDDAGRPCVEYTQYNKHDAVTGTCRLPMPTGATDIGFTLDGKGRALLVYRVPTGNRFAEAWDVTWDGQVGSLPFILMKRWEYDRSTSLWTRRENRPFAWGRQDPPVDLPKV